VSRGIRVEVPDDANPNASVHERLANVGGISSALQYSTF
jgi:hypothetical protein